MSRRHYRRVWKVTAYRAQARTESGVAKYFFDALPNGIEIDKLRVQFSIEKTLDSDPNTCELVITNLAEGTRVDVCRKPLIVRLEAGWEEDEGARLLFQGDLRYGYSRQSGPDWETTLQLADGSRAYQHAHVSKSYAPGTPALAVLRDAALSMGLRLPPEVEADPTLQRAYSTGAQVHGPTRDVLTRALQPYGYEWSIQGGRLQLLRDGDVGAGKAIVISAETGMLGSPEFGAPEKDGSPPTLTIRSLLYAQVNPGQLLHVQSRGINGIFRAERVKHTGDSHGNDWTTEIEAKPSDAKPA